MADESKDVDTNLYSRQLGVYGMSTMRTLIKMRVLIVGMRGVGVEAAKNLILAGPASVTIFDPEPATIQDLACNFYLSEADVGKPRASATVPKLKELNPYVTVSEFEGSSLTEAALDNFHVVLFTNTPRSQCVRFNEYCRAHEPPIGFVAADVIGPAGWAFSDFGDAWQVTDLDGEPARSGIVANISNGDTATVLVDEKTRHGLVDGASVVFREVEGMAELNDETPRKVSNVTLRSFDISGTSGYGEYTGGGVFEQVKLPVTKSFKSMRERIVQPMTEVGMIAPDLGAFEAPAQLHLAFQALEVFRAAHDGALPRVRNADDAEEVVAAATAFNERQAKLEAAEAGSALVLSEVPEDLVRRLASLAATEYQPLCAFYGGVVAQEVVKFAGKFTPLDGWLYLDAFTALPKDLPPSETKLEEGGSRYDHSVSMFGTTLFNKVRNLNVFVVGAGALGCEYLKALSLMGVGTGPDGLVTVTDMDTIETSNLNRQFLFRKRDVEKLKSATAAAAAKVMNPDFKVRALDVPVGEDTENTFDDAFWSSQNLMVNALDNIKARLYVDSKCLFHHRPLLESGTLGTKANAQVVVPFKTQAYGDSRDPPEESIPLCTLRHFPHQIEHCIEWARDRFEGAFNGAVQDAASFITDRSTFMKSVMAEGNPNARRAKLEAVVEVLDTARNATYQSCVALARRAFNQHFCIMIKQLLYNFPRDHITTSGAKFWSGSKRPPTPLEFSSADPLHLSFVRSMANIAACNYNVDVPAEAADDAFLAGLADAVTVEEFVPKKVRIKADEKDDTTEGGEDDVVVVKACCKKLLSMSTDETKKLVITPTVFEKDDDSNFHIEFMAAAANCRARNYTIKECTLHKAKMIAGKIIPAIATTTAMLYKVAAGAPLEAYRDSFVNLAINMYSMSEPREPVRTRSTDMDPMLGGPVRAIPEGFSSWDKIVIDKGDITLQALVEHLEEDMGIEVQIVSCGPKMMYAPLMFAAHRSRANKTVREVYEEMNADSPLPADRKYIMLEISSEDDDGVDCLIPPVQLVFAK